MKKLSTTFLTILCFMQIVLGQEKANKRVVCYLDLESFLRTGDAKFTSADLYKALPLCTHLVYSYADFRPESHVITSLKDKKHDPDVKFKYIKTLKAKFPDVKFYLSLGAGRDQKAGDEKKYIQFLRDGKTKNYQEFASSSISLLKTLSFDGLDLAFQLPLNTPCQADVKTFDASSQDKNETLKHLFTEFVEYLHQAYAKEHLSLSLTVLPNVNSSLSFDILKIYNKFEYINLFAFDFATPELNPKEAGYTAPIKFCNELKRSPHCNVDFQVQYWLKNGCPGNKLVLGIPAHTRTWKIAANSSSLDLPPTEGSGAAGLVTKKEGLLSWGETCIKFFNGTCKHVYNDNQGYCNSPADEYNEHGMWLSYDTPGSVLRKAKYVKENGLGGMAVYDISLDDFNGECTKVFYPIVRSVKNNLYHSWE